MRNSRLFAPSISFNGQTNYCAREAQEVYQNRRKEMAYKGKATSILQEFVKQKLAVSWSPEQIAGYLSTQENYQKFRLKPSIAGSIRELFPRGIF